ncbi:MAG: hypothetical protein LBD24_07000 [Spirochaetaceae bacterium]|nr:hypothetical protein [Spirochaetaceae bacterium]
MLCAVRGGALFGARGMTLMEPSETALFGARGVSRYRGVRGGWPPQPPASSHFAGRCLKPPEAGRLWKKAKT